MVRQLTWTGTDEWRAESTLVTDLDEGFTARGVQLGVAPVPYRLDYRLTAAAGWITRSLDVTAVGAGWQRTVRLTRGEDGGWSFLAEADGEVRLPDPVCVTAALAGALDCDLGFSPLTNTMPILRTGAHRGTGAADFTMAWVSVPDLAVHASAQRYEHVRATRDGSVVRYSSRAFTADLELDADGFVVDYAGLARRVGRAPTA
jgi:hypothetical protein